MFVFLKKALGRVFLVLDRVKKSEHENSGSFSKSPRLDQEGGSHPLGWIKKVRGFVELWSFSIKKREESSGSRSQCMPTVRGSTADESALRLDKITITHNQRLLLLLDGQGPAEHWFPSQQRKALPFGLSQQIMSGNNAGTVMNYFLIFLALNFAFTFTYGKAGDNSERKIGTVSEWSLSVPHSCL